MANIQHLAAVTKGGAYWNSWRQESQLIIIDLSYADLSGMCLNHANLSAVDLRGANLSFTQFSSADLRGANLSSTNLSHTDFSSANLDNVNFDDAVFDNTCLDNVNLSNVNFYKKNLKEVRLRNANLQGANFQYANLSGANLNGANLSFAKLRFADISFAKLSNAKLKGADFTDAILISTDLSNANLNEQDLRNLNLSNANLSGIQASGADFSGSVLTGACIRNWNIDEETVLDNITCEFIYLKSYRQERRPSDPNQKFKSGEFFTLIQKVRETVDLIFLNGIDWAALLASIHELQIKSGDNQLSIQAIEHKRDGRFIVRVDVPIDSDKAEFEKFLKKEYDEKFKAMKKAAEEKVLYQIKFKDDQLTLYQDVISNYKDVISAYHKQNASIMEMANYMANRPIEIKIENKNIQQGEQGSMATINHYGSGDNVAGDKVLGDKINTQINNSQDLAQAAKDIHTLLNQLSVDYPDDNHRLLVAKAVDQVERSPELQSRILRGVKAGSFAALEKMIDHPVAKFFIEAAKEVIKP